MKHIFGKKKSKSEKSSQEATASIVSEHPIISQMREHLAAKLSEGGIGIDNIQRAVRSFHEANPESAGTREFTDELRNSQIESLVYITGTLPSAAAKGTGAVVSEVIRVIDMNPFPNGMNKVSILYKGLSDDASSQEALARLTGETYNVWDKSCYHRFSRNTRGNMGELKDIDPELASIVKEMVVIDPILLTIPNKTVEAFNALEVEYGAGNIPGSVFEKTMAGIACNQHKAVESYLTSPWGTLFASQSPKQSQTAIIITSGNEKGYAIALSIVTPVGEETQTVLPKTSPRGEEDLQLEKEHHPQKSVYTPPAIPQKSHTMVELPHVPGIEPSSIVVPGQQPSLSTLSHSGRPPVPPRNKKTGIISFSTVSKLPSGFDSGEIVQGRDTTNNTNASSKSTFFARQKSVGNVITKTKPSKDAEKEPEQTEKTIGKKAFFARQTSVSSVIEHVIKKSAPAPLPEAKDPDTIDEQQYPAPVVITRWSHSGSAIPLRNTAPGFTPRKDPPPPIPKRTVQGSYTAEVISRDEKKSQSQEHTPSGF